MRKKFEFIFILGLLGLGFSCSSSMKFPQAKISNGLIDAQLYLPDSVNGYYRGTRFDWSGVMPDLTYHGHSFFGKWFERYDPEIHDAIMGPVNDFSPVGYKEARPGEGFLKIGVGVLQKPDEANYSFRSLYEILNYGTWEIEKKPDHIEFTQNLNNKEYSYVYKKTVRLLKEKPVMVLEHSLQNKGERTIETSVYNHNFLMLDEHSVGPGYIIEFPFPLTDVDVERSKFGKIEGNRIIFQQYLKQNDYAYFSDIGGYANASSDNQVIVYNQKSAAGVEIKGDRPLSKMVFWSSSKTICPEPYINISVDPGETFRWQISYTFFLKRSEKYLQN